MGEKREERGKVVREKENKNEFRQSAKQNN